MSERVRVNVNGTIVKMYEKSFVIDGEPLYYYRTVTFYDLNVLIRALDAQFRAGVKSKGISPNENNQSFSFSVEFSNIKESRLIPVLASLEEKLDMFKSNYAVTCKIGSVRPQKE